MLTMGSPTPSLLGACTACLQPTGVQEAEIAPPQIYPAATIEATYDDNHTATDPEAVEWLVLSTEAHSTILAAPTNLAQPSTEADPTTEVAKEEENTTAAPGSATDDHGGEYSATSEMDRYYEPYGVVDNPIPNPQEHLGCFYVVRWKQPKNGTIQNFYVLTDSWGKVMEKRGIDVGYYRKVFKGGIQEAYQFVTTAGYTRMGVEFRSSQFYITEPSNMEIMEELIRQRVSNHKKDFKAHAKKAMWSAYRATRSRAWLIKNFWLNCFPRRVMSS